MGRLEVQEVIHEELLAKIQVFLVATELQSIDENFEGTKMLKALRAVVELHKPIEEGGKLWCQQEDCYNHIEFLERDDCSCDYPCPTIQAIEGQLK